MNTVTVNNSVTVDAMRWIRNRQNYNTSKTYKSSFRQFSKWCNIHSINMCDVTDSHITLYIRYLLEERKPSAAISTIKCAIAAIQDHFRFNAEKTQMIQSSTLIAEAKLIVDKRGRTVVKKKPLTIAMLQAMVKWRAQHHRDMSETLRWLADRDLCMMILMMSGFLRESEVIGLRRRHIDIKDMMIAGKSRRVVELYIHQSKTDHDITYKRNFYSYQA